MLQNMQQHKFNLQNQPREPSKLKLNMKRRIYLEHNYYDQEHQHHGLQGDKGGGRRTKTLEGREMKHGNGF